MDAHSALSERTGWLPPLDGPVEEVGGLLARPPANLAERLAAALAERTGARRALLRRSGREALRVALRASAEHTGRDEVVLPAYTCWSVAAAAVAAGLRVRLVDVGERGAIDPAGLARLPLERAACVVACNLFGIAEPLGAISDLVRAQGAWLVDDAAQSFGARAGDGAAGARGDLGILSFGRGKPLQALGGGALLVCSGAAPRERDASPRPVSHRAWLRAHAWNLALSPVVFRALAALPGMRVGETRFEPRFARGSIAGDALVLCAHALARCDARRERREAAAAALAGELLDRTAFRPITAPATEPGAYPRLAVLAPDRRRREAAVAALAPLGAARLYPAPLDEIPGLRPSLVASPTPTGARDLCGRVFTLPTHDALGAGQRRRALDRLAELAPARP